MAGNGERQKDPVGSHDFAIEINGLTLGQFSSANGFEMETEVVEYREGGNNSNVLKFRGSGRYPNITLERGFVLSEELWDWYQECLDAQQELNRKDGAIVLYQGGEEKARWNFYRGWPCRWSGPALNSEESSAAVELLEIAHERLEFEKEK